MTGPDSSALDEMRHNWLRGACVTSIASGIEFTLYGISCFFLWKSHKTTNSRKNILFICYTSAISVLSLFYIVCLWILTQGILSGRILLQLPLPSLSKSPITFVIMRDVLVIKGRLCDIINIWRCIVIYHSCGTQLWLENLIVGLLYLAIAALGVLSLVEIIISSMVPQTVLLWSLFVASLTLNIVCTILLVSRLLVYRRCVIRLLGKAQGVQYASLAAMIVESALIYSSFATCVAIMAFFPQASRVQATFVLLLSPLQAISTHLIILRVARNSIRSQEAWKNTQQLSSMRFTPGTADT